MATFRLLSIAVGSIVLVSACGSDGSNETWVSTTLRTPSAACAGQRAMVPASSTAARTLGPTTAGQLQRTATSDYVSYQVTTPEVFLYFSFASNLPARPSTQEARDQLSYAYVIFKVKQPGGVGGNLEVLESSTLLHLPDFERFEVTGDQLVWRLVRQSAEHYTKWLTVYDEDPSNDPPAGVDCFLDDIAGMCPCEFSGPPITVTLDGVTALDP